jgi:D-alanine--poly(phosphoribitol) ligase subunit 2
MEKLIAILTETKPDVDFNTEKKLIDNNILDSFDIVQLVMKLNDQFDIEIGAEDIIPQNFNSAEALWTLIQRLQG